MCGENSGTARRARSEHGSSPRVRGKRDLSDARAALVGLIPACAGKTDEGADL